MHQHVHMDAHTLSHPCRQTLTHLHSSCHRRISGSQRYTSIHRSPGCSHRSGHTVGLGSASTHLHLRGRRSVIIPLQVCIAFMCSRPCAQGARVQPSMSRVRRPCTCACLCVFVCMSTRVRCEGTSCLLIV